VRSPAVALLLLSLVPAFVTSAAAAPQQTNGVVSFGACCPVTAGIYVIKPDGTDQRRIFAPKFDDASLVSAWSPGGGRIAYVAPGGLWKMSASGTRRKRLWKGRGDTLSPTWAPDGTRIAFVDLAVRHGSNYAIYVIGSDGHGLKRIVRGVPYQNNPVWSPSGKLIMFERNEYLWTVKPNGRAQKRVAVGSSPSWSPDGESVAFDRNGSLWTMDANGTNAQMIVEIPSSTAGIAWSPDGNWIAYAVADRGDIMLVRPDGTGSKRLTHEEDVFHSEPAWQPRP
jgi:Tol biopolymer transport system component